MPTELVASTIDVDCEEPRLAGLGFLFAGVHEGPDDFAVGFGDGEVGEFGGREPVEAAFAHVVGLDPDGAEDAVDEHEPVALALEGLFADHADEVEAVDGEVEAGFLGDFALGALGGAFAQFDVELAAYGGDEVEVGLLLAVQEQDAALGVAEVAEAGEAVRKGGGRHVGRR